MDNPFEILSDKLDRIEAMLLELKRNIGSVDGSTENIPVIMNVDQAASFLSIAKQTLFGYSSGENLQHFKVKNFF